MEKLKGKHNHKLTDLLKVLIFAIIMLAPIFAVASKCLYVACNKNAKDSYYGETINESQTEEVEFPYLNVGQEYNYITNQNIPYEYQQEVAFNVANVNMIYPTNSRDNEINKIVIKSQNNATYMFFYKDQTYITDRNLGTTTVNFKFTYLNGYIGGTLKDNYQYFYTTTYNRNSYLDNVFYYAIDEIPQRTIFAWTKNTGIYNAINTMTSGLELGNNNILAVLLTYWTLMTAIYIVFDIIIFLFTKMTHLLQ